MKNLFSALLALLFLSQNAHAQCEGWGIPADSMRTVTQHVLYRDYLKTAKGKSPEATAKLYEEALPFWTHCYKNAPGATPKHYRDGIKIYKAFFAVEKDDNKKQTYLDKIYAMYDKGVQCFDNEAYIRSRQLTDMFYYLGASQKNIQSLGKEITELAGNNTEAVVLLPLMSSSVYLFEQKQISQAEILDLEQRINAIIDHNIASQTDEKIVKQYQDAKAQVAAQFEAVSSGFDCAYYRPAIVAKYEANPNDIQNCVAVRDELMKRYCGKDDPLVLEITAKIKASNAEIRAEQARKKAEFDAQNAPTANEAGAAYRAKNYPEAIRLYELAITETNVSDKQADYYQMIAACHLNARQYAKVRTAARQAAKLRPTAGKPYILIGKAYLGGACGSNDWGKPLCYIAAVEKFRKAKSIEPTIAEADDLIRKYSGQYPLREAAFSRGEKDGNRVNTGCWINETVTLKTKSQY